LFISLKKKQGFSATENKEKPTKNMLFSAVMTYFQWYFAAETIPSKIRPIFSGCHRTYGYFQRLVMTAENLSTFGHNEDAETKLFSPVFSVVIVETYMAAESNTGLPIFDGLYVAVENSMGLFSMV
jgi:hypothetical protein